ncbi:monofunctional biosynthetic peptidoglycan transglycosylase [bacterium]|nr:monofunctional biosynthetic peptidoglycan transglycosylase [bacterium]MCI0603052.1 monofunctional biosynthetic peptidoglycan transglycosylase [bacterium]
MKKFLKRFLWVCLALLFFFVLFTFYSLFSVRDLCSLAKENPKTTSFIEQRKEEWIEKGSKRKINQKWVRLSSISPQLRKAVIVAEDPNFYSHHGLDFYAIKLAFRRNWEERELEVGASTITQQLMKNLYLSSSRNPLRKYREAILTLRVERCVPKNRILEIYLNVIEWGESTYGVEAAARRYFGKSAAALNSSEAALLAAMIPNPKIYSPLKRNPLLYKRQQRILRRMSRR